MESQAYPMLFSPIKVGTQEVKNRVFMPPVSTNLADHGYVTDALVDHYTALHCARQGRRGPHHHRGRDGRAHLYLPAR